MKLIHTLPAISEEASGPSYSVTRLCEQLNNQCHDTTLAVLEWESMQKRPSYVKYFNLGFGPKKIGNSPKMRIWLNEQANKKNIDIIHNHGLWMLPNIYPSLIAKKHNIPLIVSPRGTLTNYAMSIGSSFKKFIWPTIQRPALECAKIFHATAESELEDIRRLGFKQPVAIIPNGIDIPTSYIKKKSSLRTLLFFGRIHPNKGLDILLPSWKHIQDIFPNWQLLIVGPDNENYLDVISKLSISLGLKRVHLSGPLYGSSKYQNYFDSDIFILPSYSENFGMTVAEALSCGIPTIVSKNAPWSGLLAKNAGWWVDLNVDSLVKTLRLAMSMDDERLSQMGERGRLWMKEEYSWEKIGLNFEHLYLWALGRCDAPQNLYF